MKAAAGATLQGETFSFYQISPFTNIQIKSADSSDSNALTRAASVQPNPTDAQEQWVKAAIDAYNASLPQNAKPEDKVDTSAGGVLSLMHLTDATDASAAKLRGVIGKLIEHLPTPTVVSTPTTESTLKQDLPTGLYLITDSNQKNYPILISTTLHGVTLLSAKEVYPNTDVRDKTVGSAVVKTFDTNSDKVLSEINGNAVEQRADGTYSVTRGDLLAFTITATIPNGTGGNIDSVYIVDKPNGVVFDLINFPVSDGIIDNCKEYDSDDRGYCTLSFWQHQYMLKSETPERDNSGIWGIWDNSMPIGDRQVPVPQGGFIIQIPHEVLSNPIYAGKKISFKVIGSVNKNATQADPSVQTAENITVYRDPATGKLTEEKKTHEVKLYSSGLQLKKVDMGDQSKLLAGAKFTMQRMDAVKESYLLQTITPFTLPGPTEDIGEERIGIPFPFQPDEGDKNVGQYMTYDKDAYSKGVGAWNYATNDYNPPVSRTINGKEVESTPGDGVFTTGSNGVLSLDGLGQGTYKITEIQQPTGYLGINLPTMYVKIDGAGMVTLLHDTEHHMDSSPLVAGPTADAPTTLTVSNISNITQLPATGGAWSILPYVLLAVLLAGLGYGAYATGRRFNAQRSGVYAHPRGKHA